MKSLALWLVVPALSLLADDLAPPPGTRVLDRVPDVRQATDANCGVAALEAVLGYYGIQSSEGCLAEEAELDPEVGAQPEALVQVAATYGIEARYREDVSLDEIGREIAKGNPVIALIQAWREKAGKPWREEWDDGHYVVVIGLGDKSVYCEDPSLRGSRGVLSRGEFLDRWHGWTSEDKQVERQAITFCRGKRPAEKQPTYVRIE